MSSNDTIPSYEPLPATVAAYDQAIAAVTPARDLIHDAIPLIQRAALGCQQEFQRKHELFGDADVDRQIFSKSGDDALNELADEIKELLQHIYYPS